MTASLNLLTPYSQSLRQSLLHGILRRGVIGICLLISVGLHVLLLARYHGTQQQTQQMETVAHNISVELNRYTPEQPPVLQPVAKPQQQPTKQKTKQKKDITEVITSRSAPVEQTQQALEMESQTQTDVEETRETEPAPKTPPVTERAAVKPALILSTKQQYLERIAAHLERYKFYPRSARRRHIEGKVEVAFELLQDGNIANLQIFTGHSTLRKATEASIYRSLPLPPRPEPLLTLNRIKIEYAMQFSLQDQDKAAAF